MNGNVHLAAGAMAGGAVVYVERKLGIENIPGDLWLGLGCAIGSILPDIDISNSMLGRFIPVWLFLDHRTYTHSIFFMILIEVVGIVLKANTALIWGLCIGIMSHLLLDACTPMGLPYLLWPITSNINIRH